jgi:hypothetical protein
VLQKLLGAIQSFKAEQGVLVSWGGFKRTVLEEAWRSLDISRKTEALKNISS